MRGGTNRSFGIEVAELAGVEKDVTERAKAILKKLEKTSVGGRKKTDEETQNLPTISETERIIKDLDVNNLTPMQAFSILSDLNDKLKG